MFRQNINNINTAWGYTGKCSLIVQTFILKLHPFLGEKNSPLLPFAEEYYSTRPQGKSHLFDLKDFPDYVYIHFLKLGGSDYWQFYTGTNLFHQLHLSLLHQKKVDVICIHVSALFPALLL